LSTHYPLVAQQVEVGAFSVVEAAPQWLAMLAETDDCGQLRECKAQAAAIVAYLAHRKDGSVAEYNAAAKVRARVEHRLGEVLRDTVNHAGAAAQPGPGRGKTGATVAPVSNGDIPKELGDTPAARKHVSSRAQKLAEVPWEEISAKIDAATEKNERARQTRIVKELLQEQYRRERRKAREAVMAAATPDERYRLVHADCRSFGWPDQLDHIATDPPWQDMDSYRWLARFAMSLLKDGGSLFVQCDTEMIARICRIMEDAGLTYVTALAITFDECYPLRHNPLNLGWRPVLVFSRGEWTYQGLARRLDRHQAEPAYKTLHEWQQPIRPWEYWLSGLTRAGEVIADPFACTGTVGAALKAAGGRYYVGTEIDADNARVGQGRLATQQEGVRTVTEEQPDLQEQLRALQDLRRENAELRRKLEGFAERIATQSELLSRRAEKQQEGLRSSEDGGMVAP
jgi:hypothetical protein